MVWLIAGLVAIVLARILGSVAPDIQKLWTGGEREVVGIHSKLTLFIALGLVLFGLVLLSFSSGWFSHIYADLNGLGF